MRNNKNTSKIILAITVALLATAISYSGFNNMSKQLNEQQKLIDLMQKTKGEDSKESYAYAIATENLKAGEIVADIDVDFKQFDTKVTNAFENRSDVINKVLLTDISMGDVFTSAHIAQISNDNISLKDGYRALTLPADNFQGKSEKMQIGSLVDIYSASSNDDWVLEGVKIISFEAGKKITDSVSKTNMMNASAITFEVSTDNISDFISNVSKGRLVLVARNVNDKKIIQKKPKSYSGGNYSAKSSSSLPDLPASVPISNFSQLPQPIQPTVQPPSVEVIEANVKSKVTFD